MKYMGSKSRIVKDILPLMLDYDYNNFYDVFCGSCSVIQEVPKHFNRIANDKNRFLISMWKFLVETKLEFPMRISKDREFKVVGNIFIDRSILKEAECVVVNNEQNK